MVFISLFVKKMKTTICST